MEGKNRIRKKACEALGRIGESPELDLMADKDRETVLQLVEIVKGLDKIEALETGGGYSQAGQWSADMRGSYGSGNSYGDYDSGNSGRHLVRAHYSRDGMSASQDGGYSSRRYSRSGAKGAMMEDLRSMMQEASDREREVIERCMKDLERA